MYCLHNLPHKMAVGGLSLEIQINFEAVLHTTRPKNNNTNTNSLNTIVFIRLNSRFSQIQRLLPYNPRHSMQGCRPAKVKLHRACARHVANLRPIEVEGGAQAFILECYASKTLWAPPPYCYVNFLSLMPLYRCFRILLSIQGAKEFPLYIVDVKKYGTWKWVILSPH